MWAAVKLFHCTVFPSTLSLPSNSKFLQKPKISFLHIFSRVKRYWLAISIRVRKNCCLFYCDLSLLIWIKSNRNKSTIGFFLSQLCVSSIVTKIFFFSRFFSNTSVTYTSVLFLNIFQWVHALNSDTDSSN